MGNYFFFLNIVGDWHPILHENALEELKVFGTKVDFIGNYNKYLLES
nr:hypothetical protein [Soonwooa sp.]